MDNLLFNFYNVVNNIWINIINDEFFINNLNYCEYDNNNIIIKNNNIKKPIIFLLGGMAYKVYEKILNKYISGEALDSKTLDYDFSLSLKNNNPNIIEELKVKFIEIFNKCIKDYTYILDDDIKKYYKIKNNKITNKNFSIKYIEKNDRIQFIVDCDIKDNFHILEISFWFNGKVSDNFTINDFTKNKLFIYTTNDNLNYYLLPLNQLVKTTLYAIVNFFETRYFDKCYKYINRIKYIHKIYKKFKKMSNKNELIIYILGTYNYEIRKKYRIINDYPYVLSNYNNRLKELDYETKNIMLRCIYYDLRKDTLKFIDEQFDNYLHKCKIEINKKNINRYTEETDT
jgi:hypothetical protein